VDEYCRDVESEAEGLAPVDSSRRPARDEDRRPEREVVQESLEGAQDQVRHLLVALEHRTITGQATGIVMERFGLPAEEAFRILVRLSQTENMKLYDLACLLAQGGDAPGLRVAD